MVTKPITVAGVCFLKNREHILLVRKQGTEHFMLPGGKPDLSESIYAAAIRECHEEINVQLNEDSLRFLGRWTAPAANETGRTIDATVFVCEAAEAAGAASGAEIAEVRWVSIKSAPASVLLAPLVTENVIPALASAPRACA
nr:NUDIX domain-containing protein [Hoyosella altamirensis]